MDRLEARRYARQIAWKLYGQPYRWGGDDTVDGFDCSGYVLEILKSVGAIKLYKGGRDNDMTAQGFWDHYQNEKIDIPFDGCLVFWWNKDETRIRHIEFCLSDTLSIGASGGGSSTVDSAAAAKANAFVKVRPIKGRGTIAGFVNPFALTARWGE